eukprot:ANDGO_05105.mRNA.1 Adenylate cyclase
MVTRQNDHSFIGNHDPASSNTLTPSLDPTIVMASVIISFIGSFASLQLAGVVIHLGLLPKSPLRTVILMIAAVSASSICIFALHFTGMMAITFSPSREQIYDVMLTFLSLFAVILFGGSGLFLALRARLRFQDTEKRVAKSRTKLAMFSDDGGLRLTRKSEILQIEELSHHDPEMQQTQRSVDHTAHASHANLDSASPPHRLVGNSKASFVVLEAPSPSFHQSVVYRVPIRSPSIVDGLSESEDLSVIREPVQGSSFTRLALSRTERQNSSTPSVSQVGCATLDPPDSSDVFSMRSFDPKCVSSGISESSFDPSSSTLNRPVTRAEKLRRSCINAFKKAIPTMSPLEYFLAVILLILGAVLMHHIGMLSFRGEVCPMHKMSLFVWPLVLGAGVCMVIVWVFQWCPTGFGCLLGSCIVGTGVAAFHFASNAVMVFGDSSCSFVPSSFPVLDASQLLIALMVFGILILGMQVLVSMIAARTHAKCQRLMKENKAQRRLADRLLMSVVPESVAVELKEGIRYSGEHNGTVVFIDICGFTSKTASCAASRLVESLHIIFDKIDRIALKYDMEKVKLLGDGGLYVCGAPRAHAFHARSAVLFATEVLLLTPELELCGSEFDLRIGAASGTIVSGVIGTTKFAWDIWSPIVNLGSRMESTGQPGALQITEDTFDQLKDSQHPLTHLFESRSEVLVKGFGCMSTKILSVRAHASAIARMLQEGEGKTSRIRAAEDNSKPEGTPRITQPRPRDSRGSRVVPMDSVSGHHEP